MTLEWATLSLRTYTINQFNWHDTEIPFNQIISNTILCMWYRCKPQQNWAP